MRKNLVWLILESLKENGEITYKEVAEWARVSPSAISLYNSGQRNVPEDVIKNIAENGAIEELTQAYIAEKKLDIINAPIMNNIDDNVQAMILRLTMKEIPEMIEALKNISNLTMNKRKLNLEELEELLIQAEQIADLLPGIKTFLTKLKKQYGLDLKKLDNNICSKLQKNGYVVDPSIRQL